MVVLVEINTRYYINTLEEEIQTLEKELSRDFQEVRFCHNDLQYGNIMIDEETRSITIIVSFLCSNLRCYLMLPKLLATVVGVLVRNGRLQKSSY